MKFEGVGCASCIESLPPRIRRMRGVEDVSVDAASSVLKVRLAESNRVRLEQVRDAIQQDGTKVTAAAVTLRGTVTPREGKLVIEPAEGGAAYVLESKGVEWAPGRRYRVTGTMGAPAPGAVLRVSKAEPVSGS